MTNGTRSLATLHLSIKCVGEHGPGGYAGIVMTQRGIQQFAKHVASATPQRLQLMSLIEGLGLLPAPSEVTVVTRSTFLLNTFAQKRMRKWSENDWKDGRGRPVADGDLYRELHQLTEHHHVRIRWGFGRLADQHHDVALELASDALNGRDIPVGPFLSHQKFSGGTRLVTSVNV